jgi:hypothetical protein
MRLKPSSRDARSAHRFPNGRRDASVFSVVPCVFSATDGLRARPCRQASSASPTSLAHRGRLFSTRYRMNHAQ